MAPTPVTPVRATKRPPQWPSAEEDAVADVAEQTKRARRCLQGVANYRTKSAGDPSPIVNTWVRVVAGGGSRKNVDRAAAATPALVTAVTVEDGVGSATVIYPNPLVLLHNFAGPALKRILVPFKQLRAYDGCDKAQLEKLEHELFKGVRATIKSNKATPSAQEQEVADPSLQQVVPNCIEPPKEAERAIAEELVAAITPAEDNSVKSAEPAKKTEHSLLEFTVAVSRAFQELKADHISKVQLASVLGDAYAAAEVDALLVKLDELNKVLVMDEVIFRI